MTQKDSNSALTGGCQCGEVRYQIDGTPVEVYVCHCRECQKQAASAFGISVIVKSGDLQLTAGRPQQWSRAATLGGRMVCSFCPTCGTRLFHGDPAADAVVSVKGGSLDTPPDLIGAKHIWVKRKLRGIVIPEGAEIWPEEPGT